MPIYEYRCEPHGITERFGHIHDDQPEEVPCEACQAPARKILPTSFSARTFQPYFDRHIQYGGAYLTSQEQKSRLLKKQGMIEVGNDHPSVHKNWDKPATIYSIPGVSPGQSRVLERSAKPSKPLL